jgi:hypothetical protein
MSSVAPPMSAADVIAGLQLEWSEGRRFDPDAQRRCRSSGFSGRAGVNGATAEMPPLPGHWPAPRRQVVCRRKARHVGANFGEDGLRAAALDADDGARQLNRGRERADLFLDRVGEPVDLLVEEVDVREDRADPERVVLVEVPASASRSCGIFLRI